MKPKQALEFKGRMLSLTRARVVDPDLAAITAQLHDFARQTPPAVQGMPIVLEADVDVDLGGVLAARRAGGMQPPGVVAGPRREEVGGGAGRGREWKKG